MNSDPRRRFRRRRLALTPLIDVIFLLLLFFMLSTSFARYGQFELEPAGGRSGPASTRPILVRLTAAGPEVNGRPAEPGGLGQAVDGFRTTTPQLVLLSAGRGATAQQLVDTVAALRADPDTTLVVVR